MIPNTNLREVTTSGVEASTSFGISMDDQAHLMSILRDTIYTDKVMAVLREYSANAWDAHREAGRGDRPIRVTIPTSISPKLVIRDFGPGLSHESVFRVYTKYGASTKRGANTAVGMLGIGSKSGFAYAEQFTITSFHGGMKRVYSAVLDASDKGVLNMLAEVATDEDTGVEIQIPVKQSDVAEFHSKAAQLYKYFDPQPEINIALPAKPDKKHVLKAGEIYEKPDRYENSTWFALMGCIAYRVNVDQLNGFKNFDPEMFHKFSGILYFNIGEVTVNASREELKYSDETKNALVEKLNELVDEFVLVTLKDIESADVTNWDKRLKAQILHRIGIPAPKGTDDVFSAYVAIKNPPDQFVIWRNKNVSSTITVHAETRLLLRDDKRALSGFPLQEYDYVITPSKASLEEATAALNVCLEAHKLTGIKIEKISSLPWTPKNPGKRAYSNTKHQARSFRLLPAASFYRPYSNAWMSETERETTTDDIFVILSAFESVGYDFFNLYRQDQAIAGFLGIDMPVVYGYKTTQGKPVTADKCVGREYREWSKELREKLNDPKFDNFLENWDWSLATENHFYGGYGTFDVLDAVKKLTTHLGKDHVITSFLMKAWEGQAFLSGLKMNDTVIDLIFQQKKTNKYDRRDAASEPRRQLQEIYRKYPVLNNYQVKLSALWQNDYLAFIEYVQLKDKA